ncbi:FKBP-type peptidyl-prolyl cis-trans isomerase [Vibrio hepatarius]|uniref:FKBP-type peptidyl-prolyl cis-trans isomerase n=1 Tax=Vibrio hepatarius TaxID=171383 RepID=UPI001C0A3B40|nr:FKBP-type peptidyl-prolyl cis-trans isomerase [Vibrio hepatarius]MBU2895211.1 FKBP-type peptidyl-prolyl cis-trans isomerase [Vibrio hepatarius]
MSKIIIPIVILVLAGFMIYRTLVTGKAGEENFAAGQAFLLENGKQDGIITTESGLQYKVLSKGEGTLNPSPKSKVKVHYHGTLLDGSVFDSSVERGEPISFGLNQVIKGWQEGLTYMVEGDKFRLFIPSTLAYGKNGSGPIPPSSTLIFDVELIEIQ